MDVDSENFNFYPLLNEQKTTDSEISTQSDILIELPYFFISVDKNCSDRYIPFIYVLNLELLKQMTNLLLEIDSTISFEKQMVITKNLIARMSDNIEHYFDKNYANSSPNNAVIENILNLVRQLYELNDMMSSDELYVNVHQTPICVATIRKYKNEHPYGILTDVENVPNNTYKFPFYNNQIYTSEEIFQIRSETNTTDANIAQYIINKCRDSIALQKNRILSHTLQYVNILIIFIYMANCGMKIEGESILNLEAHYISVLIDFIVRTRNIEAWRSHLGLDTMLRVCSDNILIKHVCSMKEARERACFILSKMRGKEVKDVMKKLENKNAEKSVDIFKIIENVSFDEYMTILNKNEVVTIEKQIYYNFDMNHLTNMQLHFGQSLRCLFE